jgi:pilus assembly protein Flp/PilA
MKTYMQKAMTFIQDEEGASAVEYALLVGLIAVALVATITALGTSIGGLFGRASTALDAAGN